LRRKQLGEASSYRRKWLERSKDKEKIFSPESVGILGRRELSQLAYGIVNSMEDDPGDHDGPPKLNEGMVFKETDEEWLKRRMLPRRNGGLVPRASNPSTQIRLTFSDCISDCRVLLEAEE